MNRPSLRRLTGALLTTACLTLALSACSSGPGTSLRAAAEVPLASTSAQAQTAFAARPALPPLFDDIERRTFEFFWHTANPANGLVPDRYPSPSAASVAAVGFGLSAYIVGVDRGYITRAQARERTLATVRFFRDAPQGPEATGTSGYKGFFYHFIDMKTGHRAGKNELSTVDTALLLAGLLHAQSYFDGEDAAEREIRAGVDTIYHRVDWAWAQPRPPRINMGWHPESGMIPHDWRGYNEAMLVYVLALASPTHPVGPEAWQAWTATYDETWGAFEGETLLGFAQLFGHQFSHVWIDFRGIRDRYMAAKGLDYAENSRRATYSQRAYAIRNPMGWKGYDADVWGITASDGPGHMTVPDSAGRLREFRDYYARGVGLGHPFDDGTIVPTAALGSLPFAPEIVIPAAQAMHQRYGRTLYGRYGFLDAFNLNFVHTDKPLSNGRVVPGFGWVATDYLGIDQGPILTMIANYRNELVWQHMRRHPVIRLGLQRAGFKGGWLDAPAR